MSDSRLSIFFFFIRKRIILLPIPIMFICDSFSALLSEGSIQENIRPQMSFSTAGF